MNGLARAAELREPDFTEAGTSPVLARGSSLRFWPLSAFGPPSASPTTEGGAIAQWVRGYLMRPHPELGREGAVCRFTNGAAKLDAIRIAVSHNSSRDLPAILKTMQEAIEVFEGIPCPASMQHLRAVLVAFPDCADEAGLRALKKAQNVLRPNSIYRGKMIGFFEPNSRDRGLINPDFRPLRSPLPLLAIRVLVEGDAPFVLRNPRLAPIYLATFGFRGARRLLAALWA
jgi:hypothetical protein